MSTLLEVIISLAFIYLIFSVLVSGCCELWQLIIRKRSIFMYDAMAQVFNDRLNKDYTHVLYSHPLIDQLKERNDTYPHYIGANAFADALIDVIRNDGKLPKILFDSSKKSFIPQPVVYSSVPEADGVERGGGIVADFRTSVEEMKESDLKQLLRTMSFGVNSYAELKQNITNWFNGYMNATSTWYKRDITKILMVFGVLVTLIFNIDSISLVKELYRNKIFREKIVNEAIQYTSTHQPQVRPVSDSIALRLRDEPEDTIRKKLDDLWKADVKRNIQNIKEGYEQEKMLDLPIGWEIPGEARGKGWLMNTLYFIWWIARSIPGWIITSFALSYGADNWFNLLLKLINFRTSVKPKE